MSIHIEQARSLLRMTTHRKVASLLEGDYIALHAGRSTEFTDLREYVRGDDPKDLDWKASARARTLLVRRYEALRKLTLMLVVSSGRTMTAASSVDVRKQEVAVAVAGVLGHLAIRHGDLVGLVHGHRAAQVVVPPRGGAHHVERSLRSLLNDVSTSPAATDLAVLLGRVVRSVRRRCVLVLVMDDVALQPEADSALRRLRVQHEVMAVVVEGLDPLARDLEGMSVLDVEDAAPVPEWLRDDNRLQHDHTDRVESDRRTLERQLDRLRIAHVRIASLDDVVPELRHLLERHRRDGRR